MEGLWCVYAFQFLKGTFCSLILNIRNSLNFPSSVDPIDPGPDDIWADGVIYTQFYYM
jgi:hypothetical protein